MTWEEANARVYGREPILDSAVTSFVSNDKLAHGMCFIFRDEFEGRKLE